MAVKGSEGTINLSIFFVTTILTTTGIGNFVLDGNHITVYAFFQYDKNHVPTVYVTTYPIRILAV